MLQEQLKAIFYLVENATDEELAAMNKVLFEVAALETHNRELKHAIYHFYHCGNRELCDQCSALLEEAYGSVK